MNAGTDDLVAWSLRLAEEKLGAAVPRRWAHTKGVFRQAQAVQAVAGEDAALLFAAAALHEIGHAPDVAESGFVALDGARFLAAAGAPRRLVDLVANYTYARLEAELRGLGAEMAPYEDEQTPLRDAFWYCDLTTGPDGERLTFEERVADWTSRYPGDEIIAAFTAKGLPELRDACHRTEQRLRAVTAG
ncbi:MAG: phosphohydrolase [Actinobacteria bacterium]|nr:phosphohydrolase [Actinomycetota bacterium]